MFFIVNLAEKDAVILDARVRFWAGFRLTDKRKDTERLIKNTEAVAEDVTELEKLLVAPQ